jgi:hypothetical protein
MIFICMAAESSWNNSRRFSLPGFDFSREQMKYEGEILNKISE